VIQAVKPYYTPDDIAKGARWSAEIAAQLESSTFGILCVTSENLDAPWLMFEAGALAKNMGNSRVCPLLFGVEPAELRGPLVQFQASRFDKEEVLRLVRALNDSLGAASLGVDIIDEVFSMWWPRLQSSVQAILGRNRVGGDDGSSRPDRELLEELLQLARLSARQSQNAVSASGSQHLKKAAVERVILAWEEHLEQAESMDASRSLYRSLEALRVSLTDLLASAVHPGEINEVRAKFGFASKLLDELDQAHRFQDGSTDLYGAE
jgi:hypothetical protein